MSKLSLAPLIFTMYGQHLTPRPNLRLLVESGPPPVQLSDGNLLFLYNSATVSSRPGSASFGSYNVGWVIISSDGLSILQRS